MDGGNQDVQSKTTRKIRNRILMGVIAGCGWMLLVAACERSLGGNRIWMTGAEFDAGTLQAGRSFTHRAWLINPTLRHLRIRPESTCGCTVAEMEFNEISPFNGIPINIRVDNQNRKPGIYEERVELVMNSGTESWREQIHIRFRIAETFNSPVKP